MAPIVTALGVPHRRRANGAPQRRRRRPVPAERIGLLLSYLPRWSLFGLDADSYGTS
jgi:hypothetical protein